MTKVVRGGAPGPLARGEDGLKALEVALAAYRSGAQHRPVDLAEVRE
jgi:predicted dehydrogenase